MKVQLTPKNVFVKLKQFVDQKYFFEDIVSCDHLFQKVILMDESGKASGGFPKMAQKAIEGANVTCRTIHVILR